jgi:glycosyltransferase involved in cell wall biosynthesis
LAQIPRYPIIAVSEATRASLLEHGLVRDAERVHVVPPTIDGRFVPVADAAERLRAAGVLLPPGPLVLSIGTARRYKNLPLLLAAVARPELAGARVVRVGAALTPDLRRLAGRLGLADRVVELGSLGSREVATLYSACDVLAQPSLGEGFGLPVAEAMACGTPVVASDGGALPEVVGDAGVVVPLDGDPAYGSPGAVDRFAEALARVLGDRGLATDLKRRGLARAQSFRPEAIAPRIARAYEAAAAVR